MPFTVTQFAENLVPQKAERARICLELILNMGSPLVSQTPGGELGDHQRHRALGGKI